MNRIILSGRLVKDIEYTTTSSGMEVVSGCIAVKRPYAKDTSDFINIKAFRGTAKYMSYCKKGELVIIEGVLTINTWEDTEGQKHSRCEVIVENMEYTEKKTEDGKPKDINDFFSNKPESDLPF